MYAGDEFYDDEITSGLDERPRRWEHVRQPILSDHDAEPRQTDPSSTGMTLPKSLPEALDFLSHLTSAMADPLVALRDAAQKVVDAWNPMLSSIVPPKLNRPIANLEVAIDEARAALDSIEEVEEAAYSRGYLDGQLNCEAGR